ncbi:MAG: DUF5710 domain-containing protein [Pseudomonadota bacterium]
MTAANIHLKVPFNEKDQAKALGARWNAEIKQWYVPQDVDSKPFEKWFTNPNSAPQNTVNVVTNTASRAQILDDDIDAINSKLRDAYELREVE